MRLSNVLFRAVLSTAALAVSPQTLAADVRVEHAWMRATLPGQKVSAGFMDLTADRDMALVGASTPVAETVELHYMSMEGGEMQMREMKFIPLPKGKTVSLEPGGLHIMFIGIKGLIKEGRQVPISLTFDDGRGGKTSMAVHLEVQARLE